jgi:hypothetical protein
MSWHTDGRVRDDLFILACGIACSGYFHLGESGLLKDRADIAVHRGTALTKRVAQTHADAYVASHTDTILRMAFALSEAGRLDQSTTQGIYDGTIPVTVPQTFLDVIAEMTEWDWNLKSETETPITQVV